jgi:hypothetical protein
MEAQKLNIIRDLITNGNIVSKEDILRVIDQLERVTIVDGTYYLITYDNNNLPLIDTITDIQINTDVRVISYKANGNPRVTNVSHQNEITKDDIGTLYDTPQDAIADFLLIKLEESEKLYTQLQLVLAQIDKIQTYE